MESKLDKKKINVMDEKAETPKSKLLEERKAQAKELAALREAHFSIDEELSNIYEMLVNDDEEVGIPEESTSAEPFEIDLPQPKPLTEAQLEVQEAKEKVKSDKEKEKEKLRLQKQKEKEKEKLRLQKQKEKEKEKLRLQKQKEKEREKLRQQKLKEKEREKLRLQKEKEKEKLRLEKAKQGTSTAKKTTTKVPQETDQEKLIKTNEERSTIETMSEDKKLQLKDEQLNSDNDNLVDSNEEVKKFFSNAKPSMASSILERPKDKRESGIIDNLQRLREQIMAQKRLERELMELEVKNAQKKELTIKSKLSELEILAREEEEQDRLDLQIEQLELEKEQLNEELRIERDKVKRLLSLKYSNINVIDPEKLALSDDFLDSVTAVSAEELYDQLEAVQNELSELREIHEMNRKSIMERASQKDDGLDSERYLEIFNKLRSDIEKYKQKSAELEKQLAEANKEKERLLFEEKERVDKAIIKKQNELDIKYLNKEASLISEYEAKIEEIRTSLKAKLIENVNKAKLGLEAKYKGKIKDQNALARELKKQTDRVAESAQIIDKLKYDLQIAENDINSKNEQLEYLQAKLLEMDKRVDDTLIVGLQKKIASLEAELATKTQEVVDLSTQLTTKSKEIEHLQLELNEVDKLTNDRVAQDYLSQIRQLELKIEELTKEITSLNARIEELNKYNVNLNTIYLDQQDELSKVVAERDNLAAEVSKQNKLILEKNNELTLLQAKNSNELHGHSQEYLKQINNLKTENDNKNREIITLQKQLDDFRKTNTETQKYLNEHKEQVSGLKQELETLTVSYQKLQNELNITSTNLIQANANLAKALEERDNLTRQLQNLTNDYLQSEAELAKMANELDIIKENLHDPERDKFRKVNEELFDLQAKLTTIKSSYEAQIASFQEQVNELTSLLSTQKIQLDDKINEVQELKHVIQEIETTQTAEVPKKEVEPESLPINEQMQKLIATYTKERDLLAYTHKNALNRLEVEKKFARSPHEIENIDRQISELINRYQETIARNNTKLQAEIQALLGETEENITPIKEDDTPVVEQVKPQVIEPVAIAEELEELTEDLIEEPDEIVETQAVTEDLPQDSTEQIESEVVEPRDEDAPQEEVTPVLETKNEQQAQFMGIVNKEYLDRLNNIHRMRRNLETKKQEYLNDYEKATNTPDENQEELKRKIAEIKARINLLEQSYRQNKGYHPDREREYENSKTKLYLELEGRQEKLRKLQEEENRLHSLKYKNLIKNIEEQLEILDKEEQQLKEYYLNKQNKLQSKINREHEILEKLQAEKAAPVAEGRIIESQAEIKERLLQEEKLDEDELHEELQAMEEVVAEPTDAEVIAEEQVPEDEDILAEEEETTEVEAVTEMEEPVEVDDTETTDEVLEAEPDEGEETHVVEPAVTETPAPVVEEAQEKLSSINAKEQELRNLYNKYANAEAVLVRENKYVREYKNTRNEVLAYDSENKRINASIEELTQALSDANVEEAKEIKEKIKQYEVRKNLIAKRVSYLDKQLAKMETNSFVNEYRKVIEKLESMEDILQQYHEVKQKLR